MLLFQSLVKFVEVSGVFLVGLRGARGVAGAAGNFGLASAAREIR